MALVRSEAIGHGVDSDADSTTEQPADAASRDLENTAMTSSVAVTATAAVGPTPTANSSTYNDPATLEGRKLRQLSAYAPGSSAASRDGETLHAAVAVGHLPTVQAYLAQNTSGSSAETRPASGLSAMLAVSGVGGAAAAAGTGTLEMRDRRGRTLLHSACEKGRSGIVRALIVGGANVNATDRDGFRPLHRCAQAGNLECARALLDTRTRRTGGGRGSDVGGATVLRSMPTDAHLARGGDPSHEDEVEIDELARRGGYSALHLACLSGSSSSATRRDRGTGDARNENSGDGSSNRFTQMVTLLLERGADISVTDKWECTPLHRACLEGRLEAARALLDAGADVNAKDKWKCTPLHRACHNGDAAIVSLLVKRGSLLSARDDERERPGDKFEQHVSAEQQQAVKEALAAGCATTAPTWSRSKSADTAKLSPVGNVTPSGAPGAASSGRYIPPPARRALSMVALEASGSNSSTTASDAGVTSGSAYGDDGSGAPVQPWRRKTISNWRSGGGHVPDVCEEDHEGASVSVDDTSAERTYVGEDDMTLPEKSIPWRRRASTAPDDYNRDPGPDVRDTSRAVEYTAGIVGGGSQCLAGGGADGGQAHGGAILRTGRASTGSQGSGFGCGAPPVGDEEEELNDGGWGIPGGVGPAGGGRLAAGGVFDMYGSDVFPPGDDWG